MERTDTQVEIIWDGSRDQGIAAWLASGTQLTRIHPYHGTDAYLTRLHGTSSKTDTTNTK